MDLEIDTINFIELSINTIEDIIVFDSRYVLTIYFKILNQLLNTLNTLDRLNKINLDDIDNKPKRCKKDTLNTLDTENKQNIIDLDDEQNYKLNSYYNHFKNNVVKIILFKKSCWFHLFIKNVDFDMNMPIENTFTQITNTYNYLSTFFNFKMLDDSIINIIEKNISANKIKIVINKIKDDINTDGNTININDINIFYKIWIVLNTCGFFPHSFRIQFNLIGNDTIKHELIDSKYYKKGLFPMIFLNFDMGYQYIIMWDNELENIIGFVWGGSSGQEYDYYNIKMEKYLKFDKHIRNKYIQSTLMENYEQTELNKKILNTKSKKYLKNYSKNILNCVSRMNKILDTGNNDIEIDYLFNDFKKLSIF